jgi:hypothetical protein
MHTIPDLDDQTQIDALTPRRACRNALTPLYRIPINMLFRLLELVVYMASSKHTKSAHRRTNYPRSKSSFGEQATSICTHICEVASTSPLLWNHLDLRWSPAWVHLCIGQLSSTLLSINLDAEIPESSTGHLEALLPRTRTLQSYARARARHRGAISAAWSGALRGPPGRVHGVPRLSVARSVRLPGRQAGADRAPGRCGRAMANAHNTCFDILRTTNDIKIIWTCG